jgi:hypothetical protein
LPELAKESKILKGKFDVLQLAAWRKSLDQVLSMPGVVFTDLDEQQNRLTVGIEASTERKSIEAQVNALGIPQEAVIIEVTEPTRVQATLRDKRRPVVGGLQIEGDTGLLGAFTICTMGFNAQRAGSDGFVVNSHCTETQGVSNDTDFHQPDDPFFSEGNKIGDEHADPPSFTGGDCPVGQRCRWSDSAFIDYTISNIRADDIARPTNDDGTSITINDANPTIQIVSETAFPAVGVVLNKIGKTTGWTVGRVLETCIHEEPVGGLDFTLLCNFRVERIFAGNPISAGGDSGSPVFGLLPNGQEASLYGILVGGPDSGTHYIFSPMGNIEQDLGTRLRQLFPLRLARGQG